MERAQQAISEQVLDAERPMDWPRLNERLAPVIKSLNERTHTAYALADRQVHAHPWGSVGAALGLGIVFGALVALAAGRR